MWQERVVDECGEAQQGHQDSVDERYSLRQGGGRGDVEEAGGVDAHQQHGGTRYHYQVAPTHKIIARLHSNWWALQMGAGVKGPTHFIVTNPSFLPLPLPFTSLYFSPWSSENVFSSFCLYISPNFSLIFSFFNLLSYFPCYSIPLRERGVG